MEKFGTFYKNYTKSLFTYLMRMTGDYYLSGDLMQESFTRYLERYADKEPNVALLYTIARNAFFDHSRHKGRYTHIEEEQIDGAMNQEHGFMVKEQYRRVITAMQKLSDEERDVLALVISDGLTYREISSIVGISLENVKVKVHRTRLKLRNLLQIGNE
jgi:RNA polymerase sigma-70 factor (ECF subfamily)